MQQRSWANDMGERRSKVEIIADDVAPSLKWATAAVQRNERSDRSGGQQGQQGQRPVANAPAGGGAGPDDEPF